MNNLQATHAWFFEAGGLDVPLFDSLREVRFW